MLTPYTSTPLRRNAAMLLTTGWSSIRKISVFSSPHVHERHESGADMPHASFDGLRVLSLESRRAREVEKLIRTYNGEPLVVPAMRELPLESNTACLAFGEKLLADGYDLLIFLTGVGVAKMMDILGTGFDREAIVARLRFCEVVARGVKPSSVLRELRVPVAAITAEPSTWRELLTTLDATYGDRLSTFRVAVQEYGATNPELIAELVDRCHSVTKVPVYQWGSAARHCAPAGLQSAAFLMAASTFCCS